MRMENLKIFAWVTVPLATYLLIAQLGEWLAKICGGDSGNGFWFAFGICMILMGLLSSLGAILP